MSDEPLRSRYADDPEMQELLDEFTAGLEETSRRLEQAVGAQDQETLLRLSHQLKGTGGGYGYPAISEAAAEVVRSLDPLGTAAAQRDATARLIQTLRQAAAGRAKG
jgi:histidine phosphotransfer protein HptB